MRRTTLTAGYVALLALGACKKSEEVTKQPAAQQAEGKPPSTAELRQKAKSLFGALPDVMESPKHKLTPEKISLGHILYFDPRLSRGQEISCNTCHELTAYGVDMRPEAIADGKSFGHRRQLGERNSPTTYNAALHIAQFWDGRASDVEEQAKGPITNPVEMTMPDETAVMQLVRSIPGYEPLFKAAFPDEKAPVTFDNLAKAIGAYERTLVTKDRFDKFIKGDDSALTPEELAGLNIFIETGCIACHMGPGFGGSMYQKMGLVKPYELKDIGREKITGNPADKFVFKVPSLRNIEKTGPYFHDGSIKTLPEAVKIMAEHQTPGGALSDEKVAQIVIFLKSLTGELPPKEKISEPKEFPPNGPKTPAPDPNFEPSIENK